MNQYQAQEEVLKSIRNWQKVCEDNGEVPVATAVFTSISPKNESFTPFYAIHGNEELVVYMLENLNEMVDKMKNDVNELPVLTEEQVREMIMQEIMEQTKGEAEGKTMLHYKQGSKRKGTKDTIEFIKMH